MARLWSHSVTVQGKGSFPLDMLRYDCCWPRDQQATGNMSKEERYNRAVARLISYYGRTYNQRVYDKCVELLSKGW